MNEKLNAKTVRKMERVQRLIASARHQWQEIGEDDGLDADKNELIRRWKENNQVSDLKLAMLLFMIEQRISEINR